MSLLQKLKGEIVSRLVILIEQLIPNGVEYTSIGQLIKRVKEKGRSSEDVSTVYSVSNIQGLVNAEDFRDHTIHSEDTSNYTIIRKGMFAYNPSRLNIGSIAYLKTEMAGLVSPMYIVFKIDEKRVNKKFLFAFIKSSLCRNKINSLIEVGARFRFNFERWDLINIPIPPLEIQAEIVRILDTFTELTAELTTELTTRKKQYNYYRDQLLSFEEGEVKWKTLGDVTEKWYSGGTPTAGKPEYYEGGEIPWLRTQEVKFADIEETEVKVTPSALKNSSAKWIPKNCVIIAISGATAGRSAINKIPLTTNQHCGCLEIDSTKALYRYVYHWVCCNYENIKALGQGARGDLNSSIIKNFKLPIPYADAPEKSLTEQARIVDILDKFDALTNSITEGLPREIALRQKQYEYYRDLLLSFPKPEEAAA